MAKAIVDSSFLYALYNPKETEHQEVLKVAQNPELTVVIPEIILPEVAFLFRRAGGTPAVMLFLEKLHASAVNFEPITQIDILRAREIMETYLKANLDFVDCCLMALSERLAIVQVCTLDHRDFMIFRPKHCDYLTLLP